MRTLIFICILLVTQANAGPWSRGEGKNFLAYSGSVVITGSKKKEFYASLYYEHGLTQNLTYGVIAGTDVGDYLKGIMFVRTAPGGLVTGQIIANEFGFGLRDKRAVLYSAITTGQGGKIWNRPAWWTFDLRGFLPKKTSAWGLEGELTFGIKSTNRAKTVLQFQAQTDRHKTMTVYVEGLHAYEFKPGVYFTTALNVGTLNSKRVRLNFGVWYDF